MEKYGFVYIWYDRKRKMYYIGSHWGFEKDGYICSSNRMRNAYRKRPHDFKRRVIERIYTNRKELFLREDLWLKKIKKKEIYYNLHFSVHHWSQDEDYKLSIAQRISKTKKLFFQSQESKPYIESMRRRNIEKGIIPPSRKGKIPWNKGLTKNTDSRVAALSIIISKPKSNTDKMVRPSQKGKKWILKDGKRHYFYPN